MRPSRQERLEFGLHDRGTEGRVAVERFIHDVYAHRFGADISHFLPLLIGLHAGDGAPAAAVGVGPAADRPLFLECYLDAPIEQRLAGYPNAPTNRNAIVELGNLSAEHPGGARLIIVALTAFLAGAGYEWAVFTAVPAVCNAFHRLGVELLPLAAADGARLGPEKGRWGNYYDHRPLVTAARVAQGCEAMDRAMRMEQAVLATAPLWQAGLAAGQARLRSQI